MPLFEKRTPPQRWSSQTENDRQGSRVGGLECLISTRPAEAFIGSTPDAGVTLG
jgi:hypothetical protein